MRRVGLGLTWLVQQQRQHEAGREQAAEGRVAGDAQEVTGEGEVWAGVEVLVGWG